MSLILNLIFHLIHLYLISLSLLPCGTGPSHGSHDLFTWLFNKFYIAMESKRPSLSPQKLIVLAKTIHIYPFSPLTSLC